MDVTLVDLTFNTVQVILTSTRQIAMKFNMGNNGGLQMLSLTSLPFPLSSYCCQVKAPPSGQIFNFYTTKHNLAHYSSFVLTVFVMFQVEFNPFHVHLTDECLMCHPQT